MQIGQALKYLHAHKIIHRDIKLENIMLSSQQANCDAKLADFGLAEKLNKRSNRCAGTFGYVAPEILAEKPYGTASDIWSLGCLLYAMLTVTLPFMSSYKEDPASSEGNSFTENQELSMSKASASLSDSQLDL